MVVIDNFKGQITQSVTSRLEANNIHTCLLPANTTDRLQPMDLSVNKSAKSFLKQCFEQWYSDQVIKQLEGKDIESTELQPIRLDLGVLKELMAKWLVEMAQHFAENPLIIVNGFIQSGITGALDGDMVEQEVSEVEDEEEESDIDAESELENSDDVYEEEQEEEIVITDED